jgi:hypothetical protein
MAVCWGALVGAGKRLLTGESLFMTVFLNSGGGQETGGFRSSLFWQDHSDPPGRYRRAFHHAIRLVSGRSEGCIDWYCVPTAAGSGLVRRRRIYHATARWRRVGPSSMQAEHSTSVNWRPAKYSESTPGVPWNSREPWTTIPSLWVKLSRPCSAANNCSLLRSKVPDACGSSPSH